jgi:hypothetical protein
VWIIPTACQAFSAYAQDTVASKEDLSSPDLSIESSLTSRSKPTPLPTWLRRWNKGGWFRHLSGRILKPCQWTAFEIALSSSLAVIPANRSAQQESAPEKMTPATSGLGSENISKQSDLFGASLKTSKDTSALDCKKSSRTWKDLVMRRRGEYSARLKSARHIRESESISLPTPSATSYGSNQGGAAGRTGKVRHSLESMAKHNLWPTPTAQDNNQIKGKDKRGTTLGGAVRNWPTPTANSRDATPRWTKTRNGKQLVEPNLAGAVQTWPTPSAMDHKGGYIGGRIRNGKVSFDTLDVAVQHVSNKDKKSGTLNPDWVEWLMGVPTGWTDLGSWGTA